MEPARPPHRTRHRQADHRLPRGHHRRIPRCRLRLESQQRQAPSAHRRCPPDATHSTSCEDNTSHDVSIAAHAQAFTAHSGMRVPFSKMTGHAIAGLLPGQSPKSGHRPAATRLYLTQPPLSACWRGWTLKASRALLARTVVTAWLPWQPSQLETILSSQRIHRGHHPRPGQPRGVAAVSPLNPVMIDTPTCDDDQVLTIRRAWACTSRRRWLRSITC
jgi:hypothetical protein